MDQRLVFAWYNDNPENTTHLYNICTTSAQRLRRWSNIVQNAIQLFCVCWEGLTYYAEIKQRVVDSGDTYGEHPS